jgi:hypothetical protein
MGRPLRCPACRFKYVAETYDPATLPAVRVPVHYRSESYTRSHGPGDACPGVGLWPVGAGDDAPPRTADDLDGTHC